MPNIQIKNVPDATHAVLRRRAAQSHQSLQEYLLSHLIREAAQPTNDEVFARIKGDRGGSFSFDDAVAILRADRDRR